MVGVPDIRQGFFHDSCLGLEGRKAYTEGLSGPSYGGRQETQKEKDQSPGKDPVGENVSWAVSPPLTLWQ